MMETSFFLHGEITDTQFINNDSVGSNCVVVSLNGAFNLVSVDDIASSELASEERA